MSSPEQEELQAAVAALEQRNRSVPLSQDWHVVKRFNHARAAASRKENYEKYYDHWLEEVARKLGRMKETIRLLTQLRRRISGRMVTRKCAT